MKVINNEFKYEFEIPDEFIEISKDDYSKYNIDLVSTLHVFFNGRESISINRDDFVKNDDDFEELVNINIESMKKEGMMPYSKKSLVTKSGRKYYEIESFYNTTFYNTYFLVVSGLMIAFSSSYILDKVAKMIAESIKEIE